jgi:hypothetical protein
VERAIDCGDYVSLLAIVSADSDPISTRNVDVAALDRIGVRFSITKKKNAK